MKRKVEKYLHGKNIDGVHRLMGETKRYLIGTDVAGCLSAVRQPPASHSKESIGKPRRKTNGQKTKENTPGNQTYTKRNASSTVSKNMGGSSNSDQKRQKIQLRKPNAKELAELKVFLGQLKGGYIKGVYLSALERRRVCEREKVAQQGTMAALNSLNLTPQERSRLPPLFQARACYLDDYKGPSGMHAAAAAKAASKSGQYSSNAHRGSALFRSPMAHSSYDSRTRYPYYSSSPCHQNLQDQYQRSREGVSLPLATPMNTRSGPECHPSPDDPIFQTQLDLRPSPLESRGREGDKNMNQCKYIFVGINKIEGMHYKMP
jgi:hypothetical protein